MKKIIIPFLIILIFACDDNLNIEPQQAISTEIALSTEQGVKTTLIGTYSLWAPDSFNGGNVLMNSELLIDTDNLFWTNYTTDLTLVLDKRIAITNGSPEGFWVNSYQMINQANSVLAALSVVNENEQNIVAGEARFLRGMLYFDLVNLYGKTWGDGNPNTNLGVPIVATPSEQNLVNPIIPRNTVAEVYQFILEDLQFAKANLPAENGVYATTYAASALLSRVYLMQENYESALAEADRIIEADAYQLETDLTAIFNSATNTKEDIFTIQKTAQDFGNIITFFYSGELEGGGAFIGITEDHLAKYEAADKRGMLFYLDAQSNTSRTAKWKPNASNDGNLTLIRLAELYLTRSETRFRTGDISGALADINSIRDRAGLSNLTTNELTLEVILKERFLELVFEGHQYRDTKRNRQSVRDLPFNDTKLIYPIPQREMEVNAALIQNEGY